MNLNESWTDYAVKMARQYKRLPDETLHSLRFDSIHGSLNESYNTLIKTAGLTRMEDLPAEEKQRLWDKSREYSGDKEKRIQISRSIYLLETLTNVSD